MSFYVRPYIDAPVFRDINHRVIDYGNRWQGLPPEDTYSVDTHPERFAPLHTVAEALIAHARETYDIELDEGAETAADLLQPTHHDILRAVRMRPNDPACAPITLILDTYPGIYMHAGLLHDFHYPVCGCDACDSNWEVEADELERQVLAIIAGNYRENLRRGFHQWVEYAFTYPDGSSSGQARSQELPKERREAAQVVLGNRPEGWGAWPISP